MLDETLRQTNQIVAILSNGDEYHFSYCDETKDFMFMEKQVKAERIIIKPNLMYGEESQHDFFLEPLRRKKMGPLITDLRIDPELIPKLVDCRKVKYSSFVADLYELPKEYAYDIKYHTRDYKNKNSKDKVLTRARNGRFN